MTRPHVPDAIRADVQMSFAGSVAAQWGFSIIKGAATFDDSFATDVQTLISGALTGNNIDDAIGLDWSFTGVNLTTYDQPTLASIFKPLAVDGGENGNPLPFNVAAITSFRTVLAGPARRGRCYIPGYTEPSSDGNDFDPTSAGNLETFWEDIVTGLGTAGASGLGVMSIAHLSITPVSTIVVERKWATQRRRLSRARA